MAINDLGRRHLGDGFAPLKEDGWIGPKTTEVFARLLPAAGGDGLTRKLGQSLDFFC
ncbi:MAG: hypothetical protein VW338_19550 [Rhodospirillaceae bacterium]